MYMYELKGFVIIIAAVVVVFSLKLICKIKLTTVLTTVIITKTKRTAFLTKESRKGDGLSHLQV